VSDAAQSPGSGDVQPTVEQAAVSPGGGTAHMPPPSLNGSSASMPAAAPQARPELIVGAAFAGGFALAIFLRRLGR
jgi:hypothetical protein